MREQQHVVEYEIVAPLELGAERLENRLMLAGNVTARVIGGDLVIFGDSVANGIVITPGDAPASYLVSGTDCGDGDTTINGEDSDLLTGVTDDFRILLRGGDDCLAIGGASTPEGAAVPDSPVIVPDDLFIAGHAGDDQIALTDVQVQGNAKIWMQAGLDELRIAESIFSGFLFAFGQAEPDQIEVVDAFVQDRLYLKTQTGDDIVRLLGVNASSNVDINTGNGEDQIDIGVGVVDSSDVGLDAQNLIIQTGNDIDKVDIRDSSVSGFISVLLGNGNDRLIMLNNSADRAFLNGNAPNQFQSGGDAINADVQFANSFNQLFLFDSFEIFIV